MGEALSPPPSEPPPMQGHHMKCHCLRHTHLQRRGTFGSKLFKNLILSDESLFVRSLLQCGTRGMSLAVLGFRICALRAGAAGVISARGTSILHNVGGKTPKNHIYKHRNTHTHTNRTVMNSPVPVIQLQHLPAHGRSCLICTHCHSLPVLQLYNIIHIISSINVSIYL